VINTVYDIIFAETCFLRCCGGTGSWVCLWWPNWPMRYKLRSLKKHAVLHLWELRSHLLYFSSIQYSTWTTVFQQTIRLHT